MEANNGIHYCPHCGHETEDGRLNKPLDNGADWECSNCGYCVEAYILERNS